MRVAIVDHPRPFYPERCNDVANAPLSASLNPGYAAAVVEQAGATWKHYDFNSNPAPSGEMAAAVLAANPDFVLLHWVYTWDDCDGVKALLRQLRVDGFRGDIAAFGLFPTFCANELLTAAPELDFVFVGEFEASLRDYLRTRSPVPGMLSRDVSLIPRDPIAELDLMPIPKDVGGEMDTLNVAASRGCNGRCSFCFIHPYYGGKRRRRSAASVLHEIDQRNAKRQVDHVYFVDPTFIGREPDAAERALEIARGLRARGLTFGFEARVDEIRADLITDLRRLGLQSVFLGVESASPAVLKRMRKGVTVDQSYAAVRAIQAAGVELHIGFIMFEPFSTVDDLRLNFDFLQRHDLLHNAATTANLLSHNQIVLRNSPSWRNLLEAGALEVASDCAFEGAVRCIDPQVNHIARTMSAMVGDYFTASAGAEDAPQFNQRLINTFYRRSFAPRTTRPCTG